MATETVTYHSICNTTGVASEAGTTYPSKAPGFIPDFSGVRVTRSLVFCVVLCRSLFVHLSFFFCPMCCLSFVDLLIMITHLVSSNSSYMSQHSSKYCERYVSYFHLDIVLYVLLCFTDSDYSFGIFKLFLHVIVFI